MVEKTWENFEVGNMTPKPMVTLTLSKTIRFNQSLLEKYKLSDKKYVQILLDEKKDKLKMGFRFLNAQENSCLKFSRTNSGGFISAHSILSFFNINKEILRSKGFKRRFVPYIEEYKGDNLIVIDFIDLKEEEKKENDKKE